MQCEEVETGVVARVHADEVALDETVPAGESIAGDAAASDVTRNDIAGAGGCAADSTAGIDEDHRRVHEDTFYIAAEESPVGSVPMKFPSTTILLSVPLAA
jgi:hypothetical protein